MELPTGLCSTTGAPAFANAALPVEDPQAAAPAGALPVAVQSTAAAAASSAPAISATGPAEPPATPTKHRSPRVCVSSASSSERALHQAFSAWSAAAAALPDPVHLPPLLPVPGATAPAAVSDIHSCLAFAGSFPPPPSSSSSSNTAAAIASAFFCASASSAAEACALSAAASGSASGSSKDAAAAGGGVSSCGGVTAASSCGSSASPWYPLRSAPLSAAAAAAAASKRRCLRLQPTAAAHAAPPTAPAAATADCVEVTALGAGSEVGRSCVLLQHRGYCVMFDCGVHPAHTGIGALPIFDAFDMRRVSVCLITHFHLDHCGALPYLLCKTSFRGRVFMTAPTKVISRLLWLDYARMAAFEDERSVGAGGAAAAGGRGAAAAAIYTEEDVEKALSMIETIDFHQEVEVQGIKISCYGAGHVLGACMFLVETGGVRTLYTGDFSSEEDRHVPAAELPGIDVQLLICESTYGVQIHEARQQREHRLISAILEVVLQRRGKVLLPVFALGRVQELLLILEAYWRSHPAVQHVPIIFISPLASKSIAVFDAFLHMSGQQLRQQALQGENPFAFHFVKSLKSYDGAAARLYVHRDAPAVIFAAPGMLQSGASRRIFEVLAPHARNAVILTGYSVKGTLAEELKKEPDHLLLQRSDAAASGAAAAGTMEKSDLQQPQQQQMLLLRRRCSCQVISFSAHSDYLQTSAFIKQLRVPNVVLVHGERNEMRRLRDKLQEETPDLAVFTPEILQTVSLQFCSSSSSNSSGVVTPVPVCAVAAGTLAREIIAGGSAAAEACSSSSSSEVEGAAAEKTAEDAEDDLLLDVEGVVVLEEGEHPLLVHAEDLGATARVPVVRMQQKLRLPFPYPLCLLRKAAAVVFEDCVSFTAAGSSLQSSQTLHLSKETAETAAAAVETAAAAHPEQQKGDETPGGVQAGAAVWDSSNSSTFESAGGRGALCSYKSSSNTSNIEERKSAAARRAEARSSSSAGEAAREKEDAVISERRRKDNSSSSDMTGVCDITRQDAEKDVGFCIGDCVSVYRHPNRAEEVVIEWLTSPTGDMVADAVSFLLLDILRANGSDGSRRMQQPLCDREQQSDAVLIDVLQAQLSHAFGGVQILPRSVYTPGQAAKVAALYGAAPAAPAAATDAAAAVDAAASAAKAGSAAAGAGDAAAAPDGHTAAHNAHAIGVRAAASGTDPEAFRAAGQRQQQQDKMALQEEDEQQRMPATAVEKAELVEGEVLMRFWARRLTPAATATPSLSNTEQPKDKQQAAAGLPEKKRTADVLVPVEIDVAMRTVHCDDPEVRQRVQAFVRRVEASLLPLPIFS